MTISKRTTLRNIAFAPAIVKRYVPSINPWHENRNISSNSISLYARGFFYSTPSSYQSEKNLGEKRADIQQQIDDLEELLGR